MKIAIIKIFVLYSLIPFSIWGCSSDTPASVPASANASATTESTDADKSDSTPARPEAKTKLPSPY